MVAELVSCRRVAADGIVWSGGRRSAACTGRGHARPRRRRRAPDDERSLDVWRQANAISWTEALCLGELEYSRLGSAVLEAARTFAAPVDTGTLHGIVPLCSNLCFTDCEAFESCSEAVCATDSCANFCAVWIPRSTLTASKRRFATERAAAAVRLPPPPLRPRCRRRPRSIRFAPRLESRTATDCLPVTYTECRDARAADGQPAD